MAKVIFVGGEPFGLRISSTQANDSGSPHAITIDPLGVGGRYGDICLVFYMCDAGSAQAPSGWVEEVTLSLGTARLMYKVLDGTETSTTLHTGASGHGLVALLIKGKPKAPTFSTPNTEATNGDPSAQTLTISAATFPIFSVAFASNVSSTLPTGLSFTESASPAQDATIDVSTGTYRIRCMYKVDTAAKVTKTVDTTDQGSGNTLVSAFIHFP